MRLLWIDALCTDQGDIAEHNLQVMRMGDILSRATNMCIWLGEAADRSDEAMAFIAQVSYLGKLDKLTGDRGMSWTWQALAVLMRRSWFSRRWVLQEVAYARKAIVYCGRKHVQWSDFSNAVALFGEKFDDISLLFSPSQQQLDGSGKGIALGDVRKVAAHALVTTLNHVVRKSATGLVIQRLCTMETLISSVALLEVTNPRDTVYAIATLATDVRRQLYNPPDYNKSVKQVCKELIEHTVNSFGNLDIICRPWAPISSDLPSWIPTISGHAFAPGSEGRRINADSLVGPPTRPIYNAGARVRRANVLFNENGAGFKMLVRGFVLDRITHIEEPASRVIPSTWLEVVTLIAEERKKTTGTTLDTNALPDIFWRILVADRGDDGNQPPSWYRRACEESYRFCASGTVPEYSDLRTSDLLESPVYDGDSSLISEFLRRVQAVTWNRRLVTSRHGFLGIAPLLTRKDDIVCILFGCSVPVVLRENAENEVEFIGECYINSSDGIMDGQAAYQALSGKFPIADFKLV